MKLIDAEVLLAHIKDLPTWWEDDGGVYGKSMKYPEGMFDCEDVVSSVENTPAVDAVVVTRCKDCKHYLIADEFEGGKRYVCEVNHFSYLNSDGDMRFCSYGEPKEE